MGRGTTINIIESLEYSLSQSIMKLLDPGSLFYPLSASYCVRGISNICFAFRCIAAPPPIPLADSVFHFFRSFSSFTFFSFSM